MRLWTRRVLALGSMVVVLSGAPALADASIFLTGHDPDFHATQGGNVAGSININQIAIGFVTDPAFNTYADNGVAKFLFVESKIAPPAGHTVGVAGIVASGFVLNTDFEHHDATTLDAELDLLGTKYNAIVVASDFGGILTQAELDILNARSADIIAFLNGGGGIYALSESNGGAGLTPSGGHFGFLPFVVSSAALDQPENGNILTPFGVSLGLTTSDINGNASHSIFAGTGGLEEVDHDPPGNILTIAGRGTITDGGVNTGRAPAIPTLSTWGLAGAVLALFAMALIQLRRSRRGATY